MNILEKLHIIQVVSNDERRKKGLKYLGRGHSTAFRFNKFNPLSYILIIVFIIYAIFAYGFIGMFKKITFKNPFNWD